MFLEGFSKQQIVNIFKEIHEIIQENNYLGLREQVLW